MKYTITLKDKILLHISETQSNYKSSNYKKATNYSLLYLYGYIKNILLVCVPGLIYIDLILLVVSNYIPYQLFYISSNVMYLIFFIMITIILPFYSLYYYGSNYGMHTNNLYLLKNQQCIPYKELLSSNVFNNLIYVVIYLGFGIDYLIAYILINMLFIMLNKTHIELVFYLFKYNWYERTYKHHIKVTL